MWARACTHAYFDRINVQQLKVPTADLQTFPDLLFLVFSLFDPGGSNVFLNLALLSIKRTVAGTWVDRGILLGEQKLTIKKRQAFVVFSVTVRPLMGNLFGST